MYMYCVEAIVIMYIIFSYIFFILYICHGTCVCGAWLERSEIGCQRDVWEACVKRFCPEHLCCLGKLPSYFYCFPRVPSINGYFPSLIFRARNSAHVSASGRSNWHFDFDESSAQPRCSIWIRFQILDVIYFIIFNGLSYTHIHARCSFADKSYAESRLKRSTFLKKTCSMN